MTVSSIFQIFKHLKMNALLQPQEEAVVGGYFERTETEHNNTHTERVRAGAAWLWV